MIRRLLTVSTFIFFVAMLLSACGGGGGGGNSSTQTSASYSLGGVINGLGSASGLILSNNGMDSTIIAANATSFEMNTLVAYGQTYNVAVAMNPAGLNCSATQNNGNMPAAIVTSVIVTCVPAYSMLYSFTGGDSDGAIPNDSLILANDGNFYGMTYAGGTNYSGTIVKITPQGIESVLHSFGDGFGDSFGHIPVGRLIQSSDGNFYGVTNTGGANNFGTVFKVTLTGLRSVLYSFGDNGMNDGAYPTDGLIQATDGNFYGIASYGGGSTDSGMVFKITPTGIESVLYSFRGGVNDGARPIGRLIQASDGNFYGATNSGGANNLGTIFKINPSGAESVIYSFMGGNNDGANVDGSLIQASDGNFYGMTHTDGANNFGTVFKISPAGVESVLYSFKGVNGDGAYPVEGLTEASDGNFYGVTQGGGANDLGTVFRMSPAGVESVLYSFTGSNGDGAYPLDSLIQGRDGDFYGVTSSGGTYTFGTVFSISTVGVESMVYSFTGVNGDGVEPDGSLIQASDGNLYGVTSRGGGGPGGGGAAGYGVVFKVTPTGNESLLCQFGSGDGVKPYGSLLQANDGDFYGLTSDGGFNGDGAVFKITPAGVESVLHLFTGGTSDGANPIGSLIQANDGNFYGMSSRGGTNDDGMVFKFTSDGKESVLYSFTASSFNGFATDGAVPNNSLIQASDGNFYGMTSSGGTNHLGSVFMITPTGVESELHSFTGGSSDGYGPFGSLIQASDGNFYGVTSNGGMNNLGTVFMITPAGDESSLYSFKGGLNDGATPYGSLIQASDGKFYGMTSGGGVINLGTVFMISPDGKESMLYSFTGINGDGANPNGSLIQAANGSFYGMTVSGGITAANVGSFGNNFGLGGTVFKLY